MLLCLLVLQTIFWVVDRGKIDAVLDFDQDQSQSVFVREGHFASSAVFALGTAGESPGPGSNDDRPPDAPRLLENIRALDGTVRILLKFFNTLICFMALLYCLSLLIGMIFCIVGRLGGLAESGKAFFLSLFVLVLIVPWQPWFIGRTSVILFSYQELVARYVERTTYVTALSWESLAYYVRFVGCALVTTLLLFAAGWRTRRASKQITQRCRVKQIAPLVPDDDTDPMMNQSDNRTIPLDGDQD